MSWRKPGKEENKGIAVCNFGAKNGHLLPLKLGQVVTIDGICDEKGWYHGSLENQPSKKGIFPKCYVHLLTDNRRFSERSDRSSLCAESDPSLSDEVTSVLKQWWKKSKYNYASNSFVAMSSVLSTMRELMNWRKSILSGSLPKDELKTLRSKVAKKIDVGNARLGQDLIVRDDSGHAMDVEQSSITQMYRSHLKAVYRIQQETRSGIHIRKIHTAYSLLVTLQTVSVKLQTEFEVILSLYDAKEQQFFSENFTVLWSQSLAENSNHRALFVDLGGKDMERNRVYLVCQVIRVGAIEGRDSTLPRSSLKQSLPLTPGGYRPSVRQPYAIAVIDLTDLFHETGLAVKGQSVEEERQLFSPLNLHTDDSVEQALKKAVNLYRISTLNRTATTDRAASVEYDASDNKDLGFGVAFKDQGVMLSTQLLYGSIEDVKRSQPHLFASTGIGNPIGVVRKMGFPEVILRDDIRNDLYVTLDSADFSRIRSDKNVEVRVSLVDEHGQVFPESVVTIGDGVTKSPFYHSLVYYHEDKPRWCETLKIALPEENPSRAHVQFTFKHRSSNESKDRKERPFALAWLRLIEDTGTMVSDGYHTLLVYKLDPKVDDHDVSYQNLPGRKQDFEKAGIGNQMQKNAIHSAGFVLSPKDWFKIRTLTCSTSVTQNKELLGLLEWESKRVNLRTSLEALVRPEDDRTGEEVVKFLEHMLDVLFSILTKTKDYDELVFDGLVYVIRLVDEIRYQNFKPVLERYLQSKFSAALAYQKVVPLLNARVSAVASRSSLDQQMYQKSILNTLKSLGYLMDFIVKSRALYVLLKPEDDSDDFNNQIRQLLNALAELMKNRTQVLNYQGVTLKYLPEAVPHFVEVFDKNELTAILSQLFQNLSPDRLPTQRLVCLQDLVSGELFVDPECRQLLLPLILKQIVMYMERSEELQLCAQLLSDVLERLYKKDSPCNPTESDLNTIVAETLRTVIQTVISLTQGIERKTTHGYVALLIALLDEISSHNYAHCVNSFKTTLDLKDFLLEIIMLFNALVVETRFPVDWFQMICLQNRTLLKTLKFISRTVKEKCGGSEEYDSELWSNYFRTAVSFITQAHLQIETFESNKRVKFLTRYKDMRLDCAADLRSMWFSLNLLQKLDFVPSLIGPFLEVSLIAEPTLRSLTIPIFFDMMTAEYYSHPNRTSTSVKVVPQLSSLPIKGNFAEMEKELITQLDALVDKGLGDEAFADQFVEIMTSYCSTHAALADDCRRLIAVVERLLRRLFEYRLLKESTHDCVENRMSCTVSLLEFYGEIKHWNLYIKYVYKLYELHRSYDNFVEAAFTLKLHADKLSWSDQPLAEIHKSCHRTARKCTTERQLKTLLYEEIIQLFDKGSHWECAITLCKELQHLYETRTLQYDRLASLLNRMARLYQDIIKEARASSEYFRVGFYGLDFPSFLTNKEFVFRGNQYERLSDFNERIKSMFPSAQVLNTMDSPAQTIRNSSGQYLQIFSVKPIQGDKMPKPDGDIKVDRLIKWYYKYNEVQKFEFSRKMRRKTKQSQVAIAHDPKNEFVEMWIERTVLVTNSPLPGILRWFPVTASEQYELSPLEVAIETMQQTNSSLTDLIDEVGTSANPSVKPLQAKLQGILNPAVMGGISNYQVFFIAIFANECTEKELQLIEKLKDLIASQVPILELALCVHAERANQMDLQFHDMLVDSFRKHKNATETQFGAKPSLLPPGASLTPPRLRTQNNTLTYRNTSIETLTPPVGTNFDRRSSERSISMGAGPTPEQISGTKLAASLAGLRGGLSSVSYVATLNRTKSGVNRRVDISRESSMKRLSNVSTGSNYSNDSTTSSTVTPIVLDQELTPRRPRRPGRHTKGHLDSKRSDSTPDMSTFSEITSSSSTTSGRADSECHSHEDLEIDEPPPLPPRPTTAAPEPVYDTNENNVTPPVAPPVQRKPTLLPKQKPLPPLPTAE